MVDQIKAQDDVIDDIEFTVTEQWRMLTIILKKWLNQWSGYLVMRLIADSSLVNWFIAVALKTDSMTETMADKNKTQ